MSRKTPYPIADRPGVGETMAATPATIVEVMRSAGVTEVFGFPGFRADALLQALEAQPDLQVTIPTCEFHAVTMAHGYWLACGRPAGVVCMDGLGVDMASPGLALALQEGVGMVFAAPALGVRHLPGTRAKETEPPPEAPAPDLLDAALRGRVPTTLVLGPGARGLIPEAALLPPGLELITQTAVEVPASCPAHWVGVDSYGRNGAVDAALGICGPGCPGEANCVERLVLAVGCRPGSCSRWQARGLCQGVTVADGSSLFKAPCGHLALAETPAEPEGPGPSALWRTLAGLATRLSGACFVADAGAAHKVVAAMAQGGRLTAAITDDLTPMGWAFGAALGVWRARPAAPVVPVVGDGAMLMFGTALAPMAVHKVPAVVVISDNLVLGSVATRANPGSHIAELAPVDWVAFCGSLGIPARRVGHGEDPSEVLDWAAAALAAGQGPCAVVVDTRGDERLDNAHPSGLAWLDGALKGSGGYK